MAIKKITREEYVKKFGEEPFARTTLPKEMTEPSSESRNIVQKAGSFLGVEKFAQGIGQALFKFTPEQKMIDDLASKGQVSQEQYEDVTTGGLSDKEVIGSAINTATLFAPGAAKGASLPAKIGAGAATGYGLDVGSKLQEEMPAEEALKPGLGTAVGATLPVLGAILGKINPKRLEEINLRMTPHEKQLMAKQGKDIPAFLAKKKIVGSPEVRYQKVKNIYDSLEDDVTKTIKDSGAEFSKNDVLKAVREIPEQFKDDITGYDDAVRASGKIEEFIQNKAPNKITGELLNKYKRNLFKRAYSKNNTDVTNESFHAVGSTFNDLLRGAIPKLESINDEYGNVILAKKILFKAMHRPQLGLTGKILGTAAGAGAGGAMGGGMGAGLGAIVGEKVAEKAMGTGTRSGVGATLQTIADKIPTDKVGNLQITKKALIRLFQEVFGQ